MRIKKAKQVLKCFSDDTRIRIINLLSKSELNVSELCSILGANQSNVSKHLARLRLTGVVTDKRKGFNVYYYLAKPENKDLANFMIGIISGISRLEISRKDAEKIKEIKKKRK